MKHAYLSEMLIEDALRHHQITAEEAEKLKKKIDNQSLIFQSISK